MDVGAPDWTKMRRLMFLGNIKRKHDDAGSAIDCYAVRCRGSLKSIVNISLDSCQSVYREHLLEHLLIGELLKHSWLHAGARLEVSQPSIDRAGHDVVLEANGVTRHVQLKSSARSATTTVQKIHVGLESKPSGCVIWTRFDRDDMSLGPFMFFGSEPGAPLPSLANFRVAKHTKGDADGVKKERPNLRLVSISNFRPLADIPALYAALFGSGNRA